MTPTHLPGTPDWLWWTYPWVLLVILLVPLLWRLWLAPRRRPVIRFSGLEALRAAGGRWRERLRLLLPILRTVALACLIIAAARPRIPDQTSRVFAEGVAIELVIDTSGSMNDVDLSPRNRRDTRLDVVKNVVRNFIGVDENAKRRQHDLIGLIRFARYADAICPLTLDHANLLEIIRQVETVKTQDEDGTAIGDALGLAVERLKDLRRTTGTGEQLTIVSRVAILLTDGENNYGAVAPQEAGELAATFGIKVYTILAGSGRQIGFGRRLPADETDLRRIAEVTGGRFYHATDAESLERIYEEIDKLERTRVEERAHLRWHELSFPFMLIAFSCLCAQSLLDATVLRKIP